MIDLSCTECPATANSWTYDFCPKVNMVPHSHSAAAHEPSLVCITQLERAIYVALSETPQKQCKSLPPRKWQPVIPASVKQTATTILNICVRRNNSRMLLYSYAHVLLHSDAVLPNTARAFELALDHCSQLFPAALSYNSPLSSHPRPAQSYKRNYRLDEIHLALPFAKQTFGTQCLFANIKGTVTRLPMDCQMVLETIGTGLPNASSFSQGVDGIRYITLDGSDLISGFAMSKTKNIVSLMDKRRDEMQACSDTISQCVLSSINELCLAAGDQPLTAPPHMKPAIIITSKESQCQIPHMDIKDPDLRHTSYLGFTPLTKNGMYLEVWPINNLHKGVKQLHGELIFVPLGALMILPACTLHAGGMKAPLPPTFAESLGGHTSTVISKHPRLHFYFFPSRSDTEYTTGNLYEMPGDMRIQLDTECRLFSEIFLHSQQLEYKPEWPGQLALGLMSDVAPIKMERIRSPKDD